ncbi:uncharacterized protein LOC108942446 [Scleropages formosus]|uniref:uncharacterized protein LOC108942446 n=1 Tax=Scleropages formosus TaxID=113540 RepID=UPI0010FAB0E8|nr:uncharacterized protein LOC108942446 [Scleropages formosus]
MHLLYKMITIFALIPWITLSVVTELSAAVSSVDRFVLKGNSTNLTVEGLQTENVRRLSWKVNSTLILEYNLKEKKETYFGSFEQKTNFNPTDYSLYIKNLMETDIGLYSAEILDNNGKSTYHTKYNLHVLEAVPKPILNLMLLHLNSSGTVCNVSVNCSVGHSWVSCTCDQDQCKHVELQSDVNISVTANKGTITCTGSNLVSSANQSKAMEPLCVQSSLSEPFPLTAIIAITLAICVGVCVLIFLVFWVRRSMRSSSHATSQNTPANEADTIYTNPLDHNIQSPQNAKQNSDLTVYSTVGQISDPKPYT